MLHVWAAPFGFCSKRQFGWKWEATKRSTSQSPPHKQYPFKSISALSLSLSTADFITASPVPIEFRLRQFPIVPTITERQQSSAVHDAAAGVQHRPSSDLKLKHLLTKGWPLPPCRIIFSPSLLIAYSTMQGISVSVTICQVKCNICYLLYFTCNLIKFC